MVVIPGGKEILFMDQANDVINGTMVNGNPGIAAFCKEHGKVLHGGGIWRSHDVHPGSKDFLHLHIVKLNGCADQLTLVVLQTTLTLRFLHHGDELFLGNSLLLMGVEELDHQFLEQPEEQMQGG